MALAELAIFVPSYNRPHRIIPTAQSISYSGLNDIQYNIYFLVNDNDSYEVLKNNYSLEPRIHFELEPETITHSWPARINKLALETEEVYMFLGSDDLSWHPLWYQKAMDYMYEYDGVIALNDLHNPNGTSCLVSRSYMNEFELVHEGYKHNFADTELMDRAKLRHRFAYTHEAVVEHLHPHAGKAEMDETYARSDATYSQDEALYLERKQLWL